MKTNCLILFLTIVTTIAAEDATQEFVKANNLFASMVYKELLKEHKPNFLVSPFSAATGLAFTLSGCRGDTAKEIRNALHLPEDKKRIEAGVKALLPTLKGNDLYSLHTANKMYIRNNFPVKQEFKNVSTEVFGAEVENIDFVEKEEAVRKMNTWVEKQTANKIKDLIKEGNISQETALILINALYFKGEWKTKFDRFLTRKMDFYKTATDVVKTDTMQHFKTTFKYYESSELNAKFLEMPFTSGDVSMTFILPNEKEGLTSLENHIDRIFDPQPFTYETVNVDLPKFKIESTTDFKKILNNLGVVKAFDRELSDLTGIAAAKYGLYISDVIQKTVIDVEERGVEAAAASFFKINYVMAVPEYNKEFIADHPFIFYIKAKNVILFAGRILIPNQ